MYFFCCLQVDGPKTGRAYKRGGGRGGGGGRLISLAAVHGILIEEQNPIALV